jgi:hypothetical protein
VRPQPTNTRPLCRAEPGGQDTLMQPEVLLKLHRTFHDNLARTRCVPLLATTDGWTCMLDSDQPHNLPGPIEVRRLYTMYSREKPCSLDAMQSQCDTSACCVCQWPYSTTACLPYNSTKLHKAAASDLEECRHRQHLECCRDPFYGRTVALHFAVCAVSAALSKHSALSQAVIS